jgi:hypothetical protein
MTKATRFGLVALAFLALQPVCVRADTPSAASTAPPQGAATPPAWVFQIGADGSAIHQQSLLQCPASLDGYTRDDLRVYDGIGFDVSCNYRGPQSDVTIYLTRRPAAMLQAAFDGSKQQIVKRFPDAVPRDAGMALPPGLDWKAASFVSRGGVQFDDTLMANVSGWIYAVRATYAGASMAAAAKVTADLAGRMQQTAGTHLAACAAAPAAVRSGQPVGSVDYLGAMALSGITMARLGPKDAAAPVWCAEGSFTLGQTHPLYWRNIAFDEKAGMAERITGSDAKEIHIRLDPASGEVAAKQGAPMAVYDVLLEDPTQIDLVGIFNGRPAPGDVAKLVFSGPMHFLIRFDKAANRIEIPSSTLGSQGKPAAAQ